MNKQRAFTLVESLVAILVLSLGILGVLAMQVKALQSSHLAYQRTLASAMAMEADELLWANYDPDCPVDSDVEEKWLGSSGGSATRWVNSLPGAESSTITRVASAGTECVYEVKVAWTDDRFSGEGTVSELVYVSRLPYSPHSS